MAARPRSAARTAPAVVQQSTELERGGMVGAGQYGITKNATSGADAITIPPPLLLPRQPGSPRTVTSPEAAPSPGPPSVNAADLRAMVRALDESHDGAFLQSASHEEESSPVSSPPASPSAPASATSAAASLSGRRNSRLEAVYSPKGSPTGASGGGPGAVAPTLPRSPGASPGRQRGAAAGSVGLRAGVVPAGAASDSGRPRTPLQAVYGPPPQVVTDADAVLGPVAARSLNMAAASSNAASAPPQPSAPSAGTSAAGQLAPKEAASGQAGPGRSSSARSASNSVKAAARGSVDGAAAPAPPAPAAPPPSKFAVAYGSPSSAAGAERSASRASPSAAASPQQPPASSSSSSPTPRSASDRAGAARHPYANGSRFSPEPGSKGGSSPSAVNGRGSPGYGAGSGHGAYPYQYPYYGTGGSRGSPAGAVPGVGGRAGRGGRSRREELFEEEDPYVVLEQSIALLSEIEGLIRSSVELPPDHPLDSISREVAIEIPTELLEALEDTLEVIAMAREEIAALEARGQHRRSGPGNKPPLGASSPTTTTQRPGGGGGRGGPLSRSGSASGGGGGLTAERSRSSRGSWSGGAGAGGGDGGGLASAGSSQYLPPISSSISVGSRVGSAAYGRPPSHGRSPTQSPQQGPGAQRAGSASRGASRGSQNGGAGGGGSSTIPSLAAALSNRRAWHKEAPPEEWVAQKKERAEVERRRRETQLASDLKYLQQIRGRSAEVQQTHEALLAQAEESVRAARSAKASSEAQHRWLQYQETVAEGARRHYDSLMASRQY